MNIKNYAVYVASGEILQTVTMTARMAALQELNTNSMTEVSTEVTDSTHFFIDGDVSPKSEFDLTVGEVQLLSGGTYSVTISNVPTGVQVEWPDGQTDTVTDGEISFSVDLPGTYTFKFTAVPYLDKEITVEAIAAT